MTWWTAWADAGACGVTPTEGDLGVEGAVLVEPGAPDRSLLSLRAHAAGADRMPPLSSVLVDEEGLAVLDDWIHDLGPCP